MSCWVDRERSTRIDQVVTIGRCACCSCTCAKDPYNCPEGRALVQAIHDRKTAQGDDIVRTK